MKADVGAHSKLIPGVSAGFFRPICARLCAHRADPRDGPKIPSGFPGGRLAHPRAPAARGRDLVRPAGGLLGPGCAVDLAEFRDEAAVALEIAAEAVQEIGGVLVGQKAPQAESRTHAVVEFGNEFVEPVRLLFRLRHLGTPVSLPRTPHAFAA